MTVMKISIWLLQWAFKMGDKYLNYTKKDMIFSNNNLYPRTIVIRVSLKPWLKIIIVQFTWSEMDKSTLLQLSPFHEHVNMFSDNPSNLTMKFLQRSTFRNGCKKSTWTPQAVSTSTDQIPWMGHFRASPTNPTTQQTTCQSNLLTTQGQLRRQWTWEVYNLSFYITSADTGANLNFWGGRKYRKIWPLTLQVSLMCSTTTYYSLSMKLFSTIWI